MAADKSLSKKTGHSATGGHTGAYADYIRQISKRNVRKVCTNIYVLSFINPRLHGVLDLEQHKLGTLKVEIIHAVEG